MRKLTIEPWRSREPFISNKKGSKKKSRSVDVPQLWSSKEQKERDWRRRGRRRDYPSSPTCSDGSIRLIPRMRSAPIISELSTAGVTIQSTQKLAARPTLESNGCLIPMLLYFLGKRISNCRDVSVSICSRF